MAKRKPLIGVTEPTSGGYLSWHCIRIAVQLAGGRAIKLTADRPREAIRLDGLILAGGSDINPALYGGDTALLEEYDDVRDQLERDWFQRSYAKRIPILGICRGAQMINICLGGNLYASIQLICEEAKYPRTILSKIFARKPITVSPHTRLAAILKKPICRVNSLHHQSVNELGKGLIVSAKEHNGIIQAIEAPDYPFLLGVQWHPEYMLNSKRQRGVFKALLRACSEFSKKI